MTGCSEQIQWNDQGLVPVVVQDANSLKVLMQAWMNREAFDETVKSGQAVYWSRSRNKLWRKGESSGHVQEVQAIRLDCDGDTLLLMVKQRGGISCHTGRAHCFFYQLNEGAWEAVEPVIKDPKEIYQHNG